MTVGCVWTGQAIRSPLMADDRTDEQRQADDEFVRAFENVGKAYGFLTEGFALGDWVAYAEATPFDPSMAGVTRYFLLLPGEGVIPKHRVWGLLKQLEMELIRQEEDDLEDP